MPTVIDSLIVKLGLDSKDLDSKSGGAGKKLKDVEDQSKKTEHGVKKIGTASKETAAGVETLTRTMGSFLALIGGTMAIKAFVTDFISANAELYRFSQNLGLSVSTISAWGNASEELGGSAKGLQGTMDMLSKSQTELRLTGQSSLIPYFAALGVSMATVTGQARPVDEILLDLADRFSHMDRTTANNMGHMMGIDQGTMNLLLQGRKELELTIKRQKESTAVTKAQAESAQKLQTQIVDIKQKFIAFGNSLMVAAAPALERLADLFLRLGDWVLGNKELVTDFLTVMAVGLGAIGIAALPINATAIAIAGVGAALALLYQDYQVWKRGGDSFIDWGIWKERIEAVTEKLRELRSEFEKVKDAFLTTYNKSETKGVVDSFKKRFSEANQDANERTKTILGINGQGHASLDSAIAKVEGFYAKGSKANRPKANRPQRNHNPGDIEYGDFAKTHGATGSDGRFAIFPDDATGFAALRALLGTQGYSSLTIEQAIGKFAPPKENDTAKYVRDVTKSTGLSATSNVRQALMGIQGASSSVAAAGGPASSSTSDSSRTTHIGEIKVYTAATDADGIARDMGKSMDFLFTSQANAGLN